MPEAAVICPACDFILDTDFLGEEILDEERKLRPGRGGVDPQEFNLADAVILGDIEDSSQSFETSDTGFHVKETTGARLYVSGRSQAMMAPDAIPAILDDASPKVRLTPFEKHVLSFIDGARPVETIRRVAGLDETEVKTALATLADKGVVKVIGRALVDLGVSEAPVRRRPERRRLRRDIAGAMGSVSDETDQAIEEAFKTQIGLSPLNPQDLEPDDGAADVFSGSGAASDDVAFEGGRPTNELLSLASSATPVDPSPIAEKAAKERTQGSFVPLSHTADPPPFSGSASDGFDSFGSGTERVDLGNFDSSDSSSAQESGTGVDLFQEPGSEEELSIAGPGSEAIAQLANSQLAGQAMDQEDEVPAAERTQARPPSFSFPLSRLLSDSEAQKANEEPDGPFASLAEQPSPQRVPPPPVLGRARSSSIQSAEEYFDGFSESGSDTGLVEPDPPGVSDSDLSETPALAPPPASVSEPGPAGPPRHANAPDLRGATGEIDDLLAALSEDGDATPLAPVLAPSAPSAPKADVGGGGDDDEEDDDELHQAAHAALVAAASEVGSDLEPLSEMSLPVASAIGPMTSGALAAFDGSDVSVTPSEVDRGPPPALSLELASAQSMAADDDESGEGDASLSPADRGDDGVDDEEDNGDDDGEDGDGLDEDDGSLAISEEGAPAAVAAAQPLPSSLAPSTRIVDVSEEPALSALVDGFNDDSFLEPDSAVFERRVLAAPEGEPFASPPPEASDPALPAGGGSAPVRPAGADEDDDDDDGGEYEEDEDGVIDPSTGEVSKVFTRDAAPPPSVSEDDDDSGSGDDSSEATNLLDDPRIAYAFQRDAAPAGAGVVPLGPSPLRVGSAASDEATALRSPGELGLAPSPPAGRDDGEAGEHEGDELDAEEDGSSVELISESNLVRPIAAGHAEGSSRLMTPPGGRGPPIVSGGGQPEGPLDSIVEDSILSELPADDSDYEGSDEKSASDEASDEGMYDESSEDGPPAALASDDASVDMRPPQRGPDTNSVPSILNSSSGGHPIDHALPSSLIDDSALESEVEPGLRSESGAEEDPDATAYVRAPTGLASLPSGEPSGASWADGTHEYGNGRDDPSAMSSTHMGDSEAQGSEARSDQPPRGLGSEEMVEKARRLFRDALRDWKSGRVSRARMNAKLATIYDPHNEEYRAALEQWEGSARRVQTNGKPREVLLYEEAQRLEAEEEFDGAISLLRQGIEVNPRIAAFHNRLGVILALRKQDYESAAVCVKRAIELEPDNLHYKSNYGKIVQKARMKGQLRPM